MRFLLKSASFLALVLGVLAGTVDSIQSVSASQPVLTSLAAAISATGQSGLDLVQSLERPQAAVWVPAVRWLLQQPAFAFFLAAALLFWMLGYKRVPSARRSLA